MATELHPLVDRELMWLQPWQWAATPDQDAHGALACSPPSLQPGEAGGQGPPGACPCVPSREEPGQGRLRPGREPRAAREARSASSLHLASLTDCAIQSACVFLIICF